MLLMGLKLVPDDVNWKNFPVIWPNNIDKNKTIAEGRRISIEEGCENPEIEKMGYICHLLNLQHVYLPFKYYPRDYMVRGKLHVQIADEDGIPFLPEIPTKKALMVKLGEMMDEVVMPGKQPSNNNNNQIDLPPDQQEESQDLNQDQGVEDEEKKESTSSSQTTTSKKKKKKKRGR